MSKELMLTTDVDGLGIIGDVVTVADGYARNFLVPKKLAAPVSDTLRRRLAQARAEREVELAKEHAHASEMAKRLEGVALTVKAKVSPEGTLYGSVGQTEIVKVAKTQGIGLKKEQIVLEKPLREVGSHDVLLHLHTDVECTIKVNVEAEV